MQPQLTECVRRVLDQAQAEARALNQEFVGTEHMVLALLKSHGCQVSRVLNMQHVDREAVRSDMLAVMPYSETAPVVTGALPMSPKAQRVINSAIVLSRSMHEPKVSTRILLLALLEEKSTAFITALRQSGADVDGLIAALSEKPAEPEP
jgi:ATP-dependent Clp protease ATP-binding subunit ClpC